MRIFQNFQRNNLQFLIVKREPLPEMGAPCHPPPAKVTVSLVAVHGITLRVVVVPTRIPGAKQLPILLRIAFLSGGSHAKARDKNRKRVTAQHSNLLPQS